MNCGVFTSPHLEIAISGYWAICLYCNSDKSVIGARLYNGTPEHKTLSAICQRYQTGQKTVYAYEQPDGRRLRRR